MHEIGDVARAASDIEDGFRPNMPEERSDIL